MKQEINIMLSPGEFAKVFDMKINDVFRMIHKGDLDYQQSDEGIRIPVTYRWQIPD